MGRVLGDSGTVSARPGDTLVTSIDAKVQSDVEKQLHDAITTARHTYDKVTHRNYVADSGAAVVMEAKTGRIVAMASQPTYDPTIWSGGHHPQAAQGALLREGRRPAALAGHPGRVRARLDVQAADDDRRAQQRLLREHHARLLVGRAGGQPAVQELRVGILRLHHLRQGARHLLRHLLLPGGPEVLERVRQQPDQRERQGPAGRDGQAVRLRQRPGRRRQRRLPAAGSPTGTGSSPTGRR